MSDPRFRLFASIATLDDPALAHALNAGVDFVLVPAGGPFAVGADWPSVVGRCRDAGAAIIVEMEIDRVPTDHPLVHELPHAFRVPRREANPALMDPSTPASALDARARLTGEDADRVADAIAARLVALTREGIAGFRLTGADHLDLSALAGILATVRAAAPGTIVLAGPLGLARGQADALTKAGIDRLITSYGFWDFAAPWLAEEANDLRRAACLVAEVRPDQLAGADDPHRTTRRLIAAAAIVGDAIVPAATLQDPTLVARLRQIGDLAASCRGSLDALTGPGAAIQALLRTDADDARMAGRATLLLINRTDGECPVPDPSGILQAAGIDLHGIARCEGTGGPFAPLAGGEVRLLRAERGRAIRTAVKPGGHGARIAAEWPRLVIETVTPSVTGGPFAVKRVVGERVEVSAVVFADGHEQLAAEIMWRTCDDGEWSRVRMAAHPNDLWTGAFSLGRLGRHEFAIEAWLDRFGGFRRDFGKKRDAGVAQPVDLMEGRALIEAAAARGGDLGDWLVRLDQADDDARAALLLSPELAEAVAAVDDRPHRIRSEPQIVDAERLQARFSSWYELFPRSMSGTRDRHGTFADVIDHLPRVRAMGFDTLYFPPIHPIGTTNRKGPNNTLTPGPGDPGSPYAIGGAAGGHDAVHPELGTLDDFLALVSAARAQGLEIAIDFAIQCAPDHPWLAEHPGWFAWRPDGSMKYAENPPKKYQDIVNVDFYVRDAVPDLWLALRDVVLFWARQGVRVFRVDNPHTKPLPFWEWLIGDVRGAYPDAIFLAEAFTRPAMMYRLAKIGFSQSYTYFTWRDHKAELIEYIEELTSEAPKEFYRPHFFVNTPDINPPFLQTSGRPGFRIRAVLAATLSGLFGVYSGFELCEAAALPGREEYLDSEKYELRPRDWAAPCNIVGDITLLNRLRRAHPALQTHLNTRFLTADNDRVIFYAKPEADGAGMILVMVSLDPHGAQETGFDVPLWQLGLADDGTVAVEDLAGGYRFDWHGRRQSIRLDPDEPYRIWRIAPAGASA